MNNKKCQLCNKVHLNSNGYFLNRDNELVRSSDDDTVNGNCSTNTNPRLVLENEYLILPGGHVYVNSDFLSNRTELGSGDSQLNAENLQNSTSSIGTENISTSSNSTENLNLQNPNNLPNNIADNVLLTRDKTQILIAHHQTANNSSMPNDAVRYELATDCMLPIAPGTFMQANVYSLSSRDNLQVLKGDRALVNVHPEHSIPTGNSQFDTDSHSNTVTAVMQSSILANGDVHSEEDNSQVLSDNDINNKAASISNNTENLVLPNNDSQVDIVTTEVDNANGLSYTTASYVLSNGDTPMNRATMQVLIDCCRNENTATATETNENFLLLNGDSQVNRFARTLTSINERFLTTSIESHFEILQDHHRIENVETLSHDAEGVVLPNGDSEVDSTITQNLLERCNLNATSFLQTAESLILPNGESQVDKASQQILNVNSQDNSDEQRTESVSSQPESLALVDSGNSQVDGTSTDVLTARGEIENSASTANSTEHLVDTQVNSVPDSNAATTTNTTETIPVSIGELFLNSINSQVLPATREIASGDSTPIINSFYGYCHRHRSNNTARNNLYRREVARRGYLANLNREFGVWQQEYEIERIRNIPNLLTVELINREIEILSYSIMCQRVLTLIFCIFIVYIFLFF